MAFGGKEQCRLSMKKQLTLLIFFTCLMPDNFTRQWGSFPQIITYMINLVLLLFYKLAGHYKNVVF